MLYPFRTRRKELADHINHERPAFAGLSKEPSDGLEPSTPSLPSIFGGGQAKPVATVYGLARQF